MIFVSGRDFKDQGQNQISQKSKAYKKTKTKKNLIIPQSRHSPISKHPKMLKRCVHKQGMYKKKIWLGGGRILKAF